jgi:hypothetical protein
MSSLKASGVLTVSLLVSEVDISAPFHRAIIIQDF